MRTSAPKANADEMRERMLQRLEMLAITRNRTGDEEAWSPPADVDLIFQNERFYNTPPDRFHANYVPVPASVPKEGEREKECYCWYSSSTGMYAYPLGVGKQIKKSQPAAKTNERRHFVRKPPRIMQPLAPPKEKPFQIKTTWLATCTSRGGLHTRARREKRG